MRDQAHAVAHLVCRPAVVPGERVEQDASAIAGAVVAGVDDAVDDREDPVAGRRDDAVPAGRGDAVVDPRGSRLALRLGLASVTFIVNQPETVEPARSIAPDEIVRQYWATPPDPAPASVRNCTK
ncbi:hypothetical protein [Conexibacter woesei]|uniref:hypothetical protein n=1 Tax=Conexibacter woesei TaxID=191495 RepID=UPI0012DEB4B7|nr:hypothetical protein [Conexibacter woesei]